MEQTIELYFDGILKECKISVDRNGEYVCEAEDGSFTKFPKDADFEKEITRHNEVNSKEVEVIPDVTYGEVEHTVPTKTTPIN